MKLSADIILIAIALLFLALSVKEYLSNGRKVTIQIKARLRIVVMFIAVIIFLFITSN